ncbi:MAG: hypothetical protein AAF541_24100 [Pseudomonadota bacterium]
MKQKLNQLVAFQEMSFTGEVPSRGKAGNQVKGLVNELRDMDLFDFLSKAKVAEVELVQDNSSTSEAKVS